jgi:molybdate transport system substrate-binding protein
MRGWIMAGMLCGLALVPCTAGADTFQVAVAANMASAFADIAKAYGAESGHTAVAVVGASAALAAQVDNGAPLDVFLSADTQTAQRLESSGGAVAGTRFTYARGALVLLSMTPGWPSDGVQALQLAGVHHLAIANPDTAPYGRAAIQSLRALGLYGRLRDRLVLGNSVGQAYEFVATGNAELGFVALAQVARKSGEAPYLWHVPEALHDPIDQEAVLLKHGRDSAAAKGFLAYLKGSAAHAVLQAYGYTLVP